MTKPDLFEQMVRRDVSVNAVGSSCNHCSSDLWVNSTIKLLRRYHARIEQMVRRKWTTSFLKGKDLVAYRNALSDVLDELKAMQRK